MSDQKLLSDMPMLHFRFFQNGFVAAIKEWEGLPKIREKYNLTEPCRFVILPIGFWPKLETPYFAKEILLDPDFRYANFEEEKFYRCGVKSAMTEADALQYFLNPGKVVREFRLINGGKKNR